MSPVSLSSNAEQLDGLVHLLLRSGVESVRVERLARELLEAQLSRSCRVEFQEYESLRELLDDRLDTMRADQNAALASIQIYLSTLRQEARAQRQGPARRDSGIGILLGSLLLLQIAVLAACGWLLMLGLDERCDLSAAIAVGPDRAVALAFDHHGGFHGNQ